MIFEAKGKLKATSQEQIQLWKHFKNLLRNPPKVTHELIPRFVSKQLDIKLRQFMQELDSVLRKIKNRKAAGFDEIPARSMEDQGIWWHTAPTL